MHIHKESELNILFIYELWAYIMVDRKLLNSLNKSFVLKAKAIFIKYDCLLFVCKLALSIIYLIFFFPLN